MQRYAITGHAIPLSVNGVPQVGIEGAVNIPEKSHDVYMADDVRALQSRLDDALDAFAKSEAACIRLEIKLKAVCSVEHSWRSSTFEEYTVPHWVCRHCGKAEGKKHGEEFQRERV